MRNFHYFTTVFVAFALSLSSLCFSQKYAKNWVFGNFGLEFLYDSVAIRKNYAPHESRGMGIISNFDGQLRCYTNGLTMWNRNHTFMPNGLNMSTTQSGTLIQSSIIVPKPGSTSIYYSFTVHTYNGQSAAGLYYSIVDLNMDNGLGDVTLKGKKIQEKTDNKITAVYHKNGNDIWIITHQHASNIFYAYLLTASGLTETPVISTVGKVFGSSSDGQLKAAPDGNKIACSYNLSSTAEGFTLFDFDNSTGILTNPLMFSMPVTYRGCGALEFSSDAKKLYVYQSGSTGESAIHQFDLSIPTYDKINNSRTRLLQPMDNSLIEMQLAPNGKIYFTKGGGQDTGTKYLGVIENPNELGSTCIVKELGLYLDSASAFVARTPSFVQNYFFKTDFTFSNACSGNLTDFQITNETGLDSVRWDFGQGSSSLSRSPQLRYNTPGKYIVTLLAHYPTKSDTIQKQITIFPSPKFDLGKDTSVCYGHELSVADGFKSYRWNTGVQTRSIVITQSGGYKLTVENEYGCETTDSVYLNVLALPTIELPDSIQISTLDSISISPGNFKTYMWNTGATSSSIYIKNEGWYSVTVENETGCSATKSFYVYKKDQTTIDPNEWKLLNPQPSIYTGLDICFLNSQVGYILNQNQVLGTSDGGTTWKVLTSISYGKRMAFKNNYGYIITSTGAIYKSTYMGVGWNKLNTSFNDNLMGISIISKDTVLVTGTQKLYSTFDGGLHWNTSNTTGSNISSSWFTSANVGHIGCTNGNVFKTVNGGQSWTLKSSINSTSSNINKIYFVDANIGFISRGYMDEILKTTDAGETWKVNNDLTDEILTFFFLDSQNGYSAGKYGVIFKTSNGGTTWDWLGFQNGRYESTDIYSLYFIDSMTGFAVGMGGRIMKTTDGGKTWNGYAPTYNTIKKIKFLSASTSYGLVGNSFIKSTDGSKTWKNMGAPLATGNTNQFDFIDENIGYCIAGGDIGSTASVAKVYKTTDGGKTWIATYGGKDIMYDNLYSIDFIDDKIGFVSGGYNDRKTFKTTDGGASWTKVNDYSFNQMKFLSPLTAYACSYNKFHKTVDGGNTWTVLTIPALSSGISSFDFTDENNGYLTGSSSAELFKTSDGGATWQKLTVPYYYYIHVKFYTPNIGFITEDYGKTYQTSNGGISWTQITKPYNVTGLEIYGDEIYAYGVNGIIIKKKIEFKPVIITVNPVSSIKNNSATLSANVTSNKAVVKNILFEYGIGSPTNKVLIQPDSVQANTSLNFSVNLNDLKSNQLYKYRLSAISDGTTYTSDILQFTTLTDYTLNVDYFINPGSNDANITGTVVSNSSEISNIEFQYGTDTSYDSKATAQPEIVAAGTSKSISAHINLLKPLTKYYIRIKANYKGTFIYSLPVTFTTLSTHTINIYNPIINTNTATFDIYIKANKDTIKNIALEYGTTREFKNKVEITTLVPKGFNNYVNTQITNLDSSTVYYYRLKANMGNEIIQSAEYMLKLKRDVIITPIEFIQLSDSSVMLQGLINANGNLVSSIKFRYGITENLRDSVTAMPNYAYNYVTNIISSTLYHLTPNVKYYARLSAMWSNKMLFSDPFSFMLTATGIQAVTDDSGVIVFPNPATNFVSIKSEKAIQKLEVFDSFGKLMLTANNGNKINISQWQKGLYYIRINMDEKCITKKLMIN